MKQIYHYQSKNILEFLNDNDKNGKYNLSPIYQREDLWKEKERSFFIESLFLGRPIPTIYTVYNSNTNCHDVVDGKQRLKSLIDFYHNAFPLHRASAQYNYSYEKIVGKTYKEIIHLSEHDPDVRELVDDFHKYQLPIFVINQTASLGEIIDIFDRLNRGQAHNEIEKLHGLYCDTELYKSVLNVMNDGMRDFVEKYLKLKTSRMEDVMLCINIYLLILTGSNIDGKDERVKETFGKCSTKYSTEDFEKVEKTFKILLSDLNAMNFKKNSIIYKKTNIYTVFSFLLYCYQNNVSIQGNDSLLDKVKEFYKKVKNKQGSQHVNEYIKFMESSANKKSSRTKRLKALLTYVELMPEIQYTSLLN